MKNLLAIHPVGRVIVTDHGEFLLYNVYFPNGKASEERLSYKMDFYKAIRSHLNKRVKALSA